MKGNVFIYSAEQLFFWAYVPTCCHLSTLIQGLVLFICVWYLYYYISVVVAASR